jgi:3-deoxy-D-manno-octulosonic-acid transferase
LTAAGAALLTSDEALQKKKQKHIQLVVVVLAISIGETLYYLPYTQRISAKKPQLNLFAIGTANNILQILWLDQSAI